MNPFYFGTRHRRLFGVYHPPRATPVRPSGIVICPPLFLEAMRARRALAQLARRLAGEGFHVLLFDYHGTGDSGGEGDEETLATRGSDVDTAVRELGDLAGVARATLLGVRFGGLAAATAARGTGPLDDLVLWDPVVDARSYVRWLHGRSRRLRREGPHPDALAAGPAPPDPDAVADVDGFVTRIGFLREVGEGGLDRFPFDELPVRRVGLVGSAVRPHRGFARWLERLDVPHVTHRVPDESRWEDPDRQGTTILAPRTTGAVADCILSLSD